MCENSAVSYSDGEIAWVKLGSCWWPGEVVGFDKVPPDVLPSSRKPPIAVVKYFLEDAYECIRNENSIFKYDCSRKTEFITKGLSLFRTKPGLMEKFPEDIVRAETATGGDIDILTRDEYKEKKKESYAGIFGDPRKTPASIKKGKGAKGKLTEYSRTPMRKSFEKADYKVHILVQGTKTPSFENNFNTTPEIETATPSTSNEQESEIKKVDNNDTEVIEKPKQAEKKVLFSTPVATTSGNYACHACAFSTTRLNVLIMHNKTHSVSYTPYTPSPVRKKPTVQKSPKPVTEISTTPKVRKPRKEKSVKKVASPPNKKRVAEEQPNKNDTKRIKKTDEEIKSSLLADWDDVDEESNDEASGIVMAGSPEVPEAAKSPGVPTSADLSSINVTVTGEVTSSVEKKDISPINEKAEASSDSKYEFCEDEDWPLEAGVGRKIPRVKNPKRKEDTKSISLDDDDVVREVAELLTKTTVPELPSAPEPLKAEENFPEPTIVKSPDKEKLPEKSEEKLPEAQPTKAIFKTKTFFRSRHSRSQDAIGKYVAEQLNAVERMEITDSDINGSEAVSSPEARDSPPIEHIRVARLAPKIQLKKMKAEAAQLREKDKNSLDYFNDFDLNSFGELVASNSASPVSHLDTMSSKKDEHKIVRDVLYPTQEIKPVNMDNGDLMNSLTQKPKAIEEITQLKTDHSTDSKIDAVKVQEHVSVVAKSEYPTPEIKSVNVDNEDVMNTMTPKPICIVDIKQSKTDNSIDSKIDAVQVEEHVGVVAESEYPTQEIKPVSMDTGDLMDTLTQKPICIEVISQSKTDNYIDSKSDAVQVQEHVNVAAESDEIKLQEIESKIEDDLQKVDKPESIEDVAIADFIQKSSCALTEIQTTVHTETCNTNNLEPVSNISVMEESSDAVAPHRDLNNVMIVPEVHNAIQEPELHSIVQDTEIQQPEVNAGSQDSEIHSVAQGLRVDTIQKSSNEVNNLNVDPIEVKFNKNYEEITQPYMNESTASAVDALLSVSREADRVTRVCDDPPEDLFEDDNKDSNGMGNDINGFNDNITLESTVNNVKYTVPLTYEEKNFVPNIDVNKFTNSDKPHQNIIETVLVDNAITTVDSVPDIVETPPSESVLQIAETLLQLPSTAIQSNTPNDNQIENINIALCNESSPDELTLLPKATVIVNENVQPIKEQQLILPKAKSILISNNDNSHRYETEQEKSENLNAAQSLVQMSESVDHKINLDQNTVNKDISDTALNIKQNNGLDVVNETDKKIGTKALQNNKDNSTHKRLKTDTASPKLLKILEEPCTPKFAANKSAIKQSTFSGKEKILNFDVAKSSIKGKSEAPKQKIIIRRTTPGRNTLTKISDITTPDKIILSRSKNPGQDGSVQTFTIQTTKDAASDNNAIIVPPKIRKLTKPPVKLQKIKPQNSLVAPITEGKVASATNADQTIFDINSMPIVLSEDLLTAESIDKMPIVMSDVNMISQTSNPPKLVKTKQTVDNERLTVTATTNKPEVKTLLMNPVTDVTKVSTPNILSKSSKLRGAKPMLVIDKTTGKQKIIMTKAEPIVKEVKQPPALIQTVQQTANKTEKFIILPTTNSPRPGRTQKIVIDPQTGKAHVLVSKGPDTPQVSSTETKPIAAKLLPSSSDASTSNNTVMIITNAQGGQSRIVLTPEHEKMLFPKKQQPNVTQLKTIAHRISTNPGTSTKTVITSVAPTRTQNITPVKTQTRIVPKQPQKSAIITSKGQLIVGGRVATTAQNIAQMSEMRQVPKRIIASEPKKLVQTIQKASSEPLIFLQQKSGTVMQLTAAQFEHLQRTGQIVQKTTAPPMQENKLIVQKTITLPLPEAAVPTIQKARARKTVTESPLPLKRLKQEISVAPTPAPPVPFLAPLSNTTSNVPCISSSVSLTPTSHTFSELDNFEELLPSTAIARQMEPIVTPDPTPVVEPEVQVAPPPAPISDGQLSAVPGEYFGGPVGTFYLCLDENGTFTPIDHRPLILENNQLVPMPEPLPNIGAQPERRDILEAALANSDVFQADPVRDEVPDFRDLNANVSVHCRVSETSTMLNQAPIMTPVEVPTKVDSEPAISSNLEDGLAVIGITPHTVPTSLELPITVTDPRIAPKTTDPLSCRSTYTTNSLLPSPTTEMTYITTEETDIPMGASISMPLLTDDESVGKSMPILTDDVAERTVSSVDSTVGSPSSIDVRESENEDCSQWTRRLLTPNSDTSEASTEIPLQPTIKLSVNELSRHS